MDIGYQTPDVTLGQKIAVLSCQGLMNRKNEENDNAVYTIKEGWDQQWLDTAIDYDPDWEVVSVRLWSLFNGGSELRT